jgi:hypothetical protein
MGNFHDAWQRLFKPTISNCLRRSLFPLQLFFLAPTEITPGLSRHRLAEARNWTSRLVQQEELWMEQGTLVIWTSRKVMVVKGLQPANKSLVQQGWFQRRFEAYVWWKTYIDFAITPLLENKPVVCALSASYISTFVGYPVCLLFLHWSNLLIWLFSSWILWSRDYRLPRQECQSSSLLVSSIGKKE